MKLISHRGNIHGSNMELENDPNQIDICIEMGYDVEVDLRYDELTGSLWLGHDEPQYPITWTWLSQRSHELWIHCKDFKTLNEMSCFARTSDSMPGYNYFWHQTDDYTLTSKGYIWTYPDKKVGPRSVLVDVNGEGIDQECYGICSDHVGQLK